MENTIVAIMYDFDRTLSTEDMQNYRFIPSLGMDADTFWKTANAFGAENHMDGILAYMYTMVRLSKEKGAQFTRDKLVEMGRGIKFFPGVDTWFDRINEFGKSLGVSVEHYVISSGLREIVSGCSINDKFSEIFASEFIYDNENHPIWPKLAVNYTNKTQFIYRINKGVLDISNDRDLNMSMPDECKRVHFSNMIYMGDGLSDVPCMKMVKTYGGQSIAVYDPTLKDTSKVRELLLKQRVDYIYPSDYSEGKDLERTVKNIIKKMAINDELVKESRVQRLRVNG